MNAGTYKNALGEDLIAFAKPLGGVGFAVDPAFQAIF
jgi:hypothetical protein